MNYPNIIIRKDDDVKFIHLGNGLYKTEWGHNNGSIGQTPLSAFNENNFKFIY